MTDRLGELSAAGVSIWLDDFSRERLDSGSLQELIDTSHVVGVTTNPSIFGKAMSSGDAYTEQLRELKATGAELADIVTTLTTDDVRAACDLFTPIYLATEGSDGRVSIEVDPRLAHDTQPSIEQAHLLRDLVDRPNAYVKIPATREGLPAITGALAAGISINVTLIFSVERYTEVLNAWMDGLEQAHDKGIDLTDLHSVASVFVSRTDVEVDKRLDALQSQEARQLKGKAALAVARLCNEAFENAIASERWQTLAGYGARPQRPLWASTGTKDPGYRDTLYIEELVTHGTVNTMPEKTMQAFADHGEVRGDTVRGTYDTSREILDAVEAAGVDMVDVFAVLEREGVTKFIDAWEELMTTLQDQLDKL
ncbi:transaldolase [Tessaracoccus antarcticus]|uniref:Transaldolase n=1 Tax=Tessaracoccus antarcticus TaxID=2479848 RepID=A0A3M0GJA8_9ACTN|nr:transaldolase [Tessaracoccus antarcticus]RMB61703.1 transaldolase [Tessaracoccus antarcticus]